MTIGEKIKELRTKKNLTQKDLADHFSTSYQTVSKWENDVNEPDIATLKKLSLLFGVSLDELVGVDKEVKQEDTPINNDVSLPISEEVQVSEPQPLTRKEKTKKRTQRR